MSGFWPAVSLIYGCGGEAKGVEWEICWLNTRIASGLPSRLAVLVDGWMDGWRCCENNSLTGPAMLRLWAQPEAQLQPPFQPGDQHGQHRPPDTSGQRFITAFTGQHPHIYNLSPRRSIERMEAGCWMEG